MATNGVILKTYVRLDGAGRVVAGSAVKRQKRPKNGQWLEIPSAICCDPLTICETTTTP
jgi:hypothetical protein